LNDERLITTNKEIDEYMTEIKNFKGVFMSDELHKIKYNKNMSFIMNYDTIDRPGSHWVAVYVRDGNVYYFDSFALPPHQAINDYFKNKFIMYNTNQLQNLDEVICGELAMVFIKLMDKNLSFTEVIKNMRK
jgi:hypothetical protein